MELIALILVLPSILSQVHFNGDDPFVWTKLGGLRGVYQTINGKRVAAFLGVPFAQPPLGALRFEKPESVKHWWNGYCPPSNSKLARADCKEVDRDNPVKPCEDCVRNAKKLANSCMLSPDHTFPKFRGSEMWNPPNSTEVSEDCLYLNIWVPMKPTGEVLVWIFGGGFFSGSPSLDLYNGKVMTAEHDIIVVNINYRLGPFGFLYIGEDTTVRGNMGLLDQQLALKWISENIGDFQGDPRKVTLFGESAGSASVTAHLLARDSHSYFSKIICLSGSITNLWATRSPEAVREVSYTLSKKLNCSDDEAPSSIVQCLKDKKASDIQAANDDVFLEEQHPMSFPFVPIDEDDVFFKGRVSDHLENRNFKTDAAAIFGTVSDEGTFWLPYYLSGNGFVFNNSFSSEDERNQALINEDQFDSSMKKFMPYFKGTQDSWNELYNEYMELFSLKPKSTSEKLRDGVGRFVGDLFFTCNLSDFTKTFAEGTTASVYAYYFKMRSSANPWPKWMGVMHGYEIEYMFGQPISVPSLYDESRRSIEREFSKYIMKMWADFIKTGTPSTNWTSYSTSERKALVLDEHTMKSLTSNYVDFNKKQCELINNAKPAVPVGDEQHD